jgi:asparagine synthase (glutamine-hydrolysing)
VDSSAVVAMARETNPDIACFTIKSAGPQENGVTEDFPYAQKVAKHLGVDLHVVTTSPERMASDIEKMVFQLDEPLGDAAPLNVLYISELAREHGIKVLLSGTGGDDLFTGYRRHYAVLLDQYWLWMPQGLRRALKRVMNGLDKRKAWQRRIWKFFEGANLDGDARLANYFFWIAEAELLSLYTEEFREEIGNILASEPLLDFLRPLPKSVSPLARMLTLEQRFFLADHNLIYTDKMSMAVGVEVRVPFLDIELVDFASRIPDNFKQRGAVSKWVLKKAMESYLPLELIHRPKTGFGAPLRRWMRHELRPLLGDLLSGESLRRRGLFEPAAVQRLIDANDSGRLDVSHTLLSLLCIEIWCRRFVDHDYC